MTIFKYFQGDGGLKVENRFIYLDFISFIELVQ